MPTEEEVLKIGKKLEKMIASNTTVSIVIGFRAFSFLRFLSICGNWQHELKKAG